MGRSVQRRDYCYSPSLQATFVCPNRSWDVAGDERMDNSQSLTRQINYLRIHGLVDLPDADDILSDECARIPLKTSKGCTIPRHRAML